jgi:hypothetical protein
MINIKGFETGIITGQHSAAFFGYQFKISTNQFNTFYTLSVLESEFETKMNFDGATIQTCYFRKRQADI